MPATMTTGIRAAWCDAWRDRSFRAHALATPPAVALALAELARFLLWVERRPGVRLNDPVLAILPARDLSWPIFAVLYAALAVGLVALARHPRAIVTGAQAYVVMLGLRAAAMAVTPLDPPAGLVPLRDPLTEWLGTHHVLTRDLFFSGHTSTLFLLLCVVPSRRAKLAVSASVVAVAMGVLWQHAHYTVDVLAAPPFALASLALVRVLQRSPSAAAYPASPSP